MRHDDELARLLRQAARGGLRLSRAQSAPADQAQVEGPEGPLHLPAGVLNRVLSDGLLCRRGENLVLEEAGRSYLRRRAAAREEAFLEQHGTILALDLRSQDAPAARSAGQAHPRQTSSGTAGSGRLRLNRDESPLSQLARMKDKTGAAFFPEPALEAGERLLGDFTRAGLQPRLTARLEPRLESRSSGGRGGMGDLTDAMAAGRIAFGRAVTAMGPELAGVAVDVCCFMKGLEAVERERQWPARSAKLMLRTALLSLARHYRPPPRPRLRGWNEGEGEGGGPPPKG